MTSQWGQYLILIKGVSTAKAGCQNGSAHASTPTASGERGAWVGHFTLKLTVNFKDFSKLKNFMVNFKDFLHPCISLITTIGQVGEYRETTELMKTIASCSYTNGQWQIDLATVTAKSDNIQNN
jgi:hypothetical protein